MKRSGLRPTPPTSARRQSTVTHRSGHSTVPSRRLPGRPTTLKPPARRVAKTKPPLRAPRSAPPPRTKVARVMDDAESSLLDLVDNLLAKGVMLNADVILALAGVDLIYLRLSALLCAADRVLPHPGRR